MNSAYYVHSFIHVYSRDNGISPQSYSTAVVYFLMACGSHLEVFWLSTMGLKGILLTSVCPQSLLNLQCKGHPC